MHFLAGKKGAFGTIGGNLSGFNNWYSKTAPNTSAGNIGITANAFANLLKDDFFWRNSLNINLGWVKIDNTDSDTDSDQFETATDVFNITSLYGKRINKKWAMSGLAEYRTTLIDNFNNPGYFRCWYWFNLDSFIKISGGHASRKLQFYFYRI